MTSPADLQVQRSRRVSSRTLFALFSLVILAIFFLPYAVAVRPSVSVSYVAGYNNSLAVVCLLAGGLLIAYIAGDALTSSDGRDSALRLWHLAVAECVIGIFVVFRTHFPAGIERQNVGHTQQMILAGRVLYKGTAFFYGPLLVMPGVWLARYAHLSPGHAYCASLVLQWLLGIAAMYFVVSRLPVAVRHRAVFFAYLLLTEATSIANEGVNYTPFRRFAAAALVTIVFLVWKRGSSMQASGVGIAAFAIALCISPEQAVGVGCGVAAWFVLCAFRQKQKNCWWAVAAFVAGVACCCAYAATTGYFHEFLAAASGGFAFPILSTAYNAFILVVYIVAIAAGVRAAFGARFEPLISLWVLTGLAMLPAAFGRCDGGHVLVAMPALLIGLAVLLSKQRYRPYAITFLGVTTLWPVTAQWFSNTLVLTHYAVGRWHRDHSSAVPKQPIASLPPKTATPKVDVQLLTPVTYDDVPCDRRYFTPTIDFSADVPYKLGCVDQGYKRALADIYDASQIQQKIDELSAHRLQPLLIQNVPFDELFAPQEANVGVLPFLEGSPYLYLPTEKNRPLPFMPIGDFILTHYRPGALVADSRLRIWEPLAQSQ